MRMHALIEALWKRHHLSVLLITHDVDEAILLADRALVIEKGRMVASIVIDLPRPRELSHPGFLGLRRQLLSAIGVTDTQSPTAFADPQATPQSAVLSRSIVMA